MALFYLIRHAATASTGHALAGRAAGVVLSAAGLQQATALAERLASEPIQRVISSPLERTRQTGESLAKRLGIALEVSQQLLELDFGDWTGATFDQLAGDPRWTPFNALRSGTRIPHGELMLEAQARIVSLMLQLRDVNSATICALVSHGDIIRAALLYWLGMPLDLVHRLEIAPASISVVRLDSHGAQVLLLNAGASSLWALS